MRTASITISYTCTDVAVTVNKIIVVVVVPIVIIKAYTMER